MWAFPGKQLLFMGAELGDEQEWSEERGLDWDLLADPARGGVHRLVRDLNRVYRATPGAVDAGHHAGRLPLDRLRGLAATTRSRSCGIAPNGDAAGLRGELRRRSRTRATGSACRRRRWPR